MNSVLVMLVYGAALLVALALLYFFHASWYWHVLSVAAALALGLLPLPSEWRIPDLLVGFVFVLLFAWGLAAPFFPQRHVTRRA